MSRTLTASVEETRRSERVEAQYLVLAFDCASPLSPPARLHLDVADVHIGRGTGRAWRRSKGVLSIELPGGSISSTHARITGPSPWTIEDLGSKNGTFVNGARLEQPTALRDGDVIQFGQTVAVFRALQHAGTAHDDVATLASPSTLHPGWAAALETLLRAGKSAAPILLLGETGTGKEVLARAVHTASGRNPFVAVNCGAIVKTLIESELFGSKKGAFSGASEERLGLVRAAEGGTLFLDEIAELPEPSQVALLRVLQEHEVLPVGATRPLPVDIRVVAATHTNLAARVADGRFRADLHSRISGHVTELPTLRGRIEDIGLLVAQMLPQLAEERAARITFSRAAGRALFAAPWTYNVRELEQALTAALAITLDDQIDIGHLPATRETVREGKGPADDERDRILAALEACAGNQTRAAKALGISRATLVNKLAIHRLPRPRK